MKHAPIYKCTVCHETEGFLHNQGYEGCRGKGYVRGPRAPEHTGRLTVRRDNKRAEYVIRAMFEVWLLQSLDKSNALPSKLEITVECGA